MTPNGCLLCSPDRAAAVFGRRTVWRDELWRLSVIEEGSPIIGFAHLEPIRHIPHLTDLGGEEAATLGPTLARVTATLKSVTEAELVYDYVFGERVAHLHYNLAPQREGDPHVGGPGLVRPAAPVISRDKLRAVSREVETAFSDAP